MLKIIQGNLLLTMKRAEAAVSAFRAAQELRPDIRSYQGSSLYLEKIYCCVNCISFSHFMYSAVNIYFEVLMVENLEIYRLLT